MAWWAAPLDPYETNESLARREVTVPDGTRGEVVGVIHDDRLRHPIQIVVTVQDARGYSYYAARPAGVSARWQIAEIDDLWKILDSYGTNTVQRPIAPSMLQWLIPLQDNWASQQPVYRGRQWKGRYTPNPIPPAPVPQSWHQAGASYETWATRTFAPGTHVKWIAWANVSVPLGSHGAAATAAVPPEARGVVVAWHPDNMGRPAYLAIRLQDPTAYMPYGRERQALEYILHGPIASRQHIVREHIMSLDKRLVALDDNWASPRPRWARPRPNTSGSRRLTQSPELRTLIAAAEAQGWRVEKTPGNHVRFMSPDVRVPPIVTGSTPSDVRATRNLRSLLRRHGLDV